MCINKINVFLFLIRLGSDSNPARSSKERLADMQSMGNRPVRPRPLSINFASQSTLTSLWR
jgi:hypothetical protein